MGDSDSVEKEAEEKTKQIGGKKRGNKFQEGQVKEGWIALTHHVHRAHGCCSYFLFSG